MGFIGTGGRMGFGTRSEGGVYQNFRLRCTTTTFLYLSHSAVVIPCESDPPVPNGEKRRGRERPPKKAGGHVTPDSGTEYHTAIRPHAGRSRPYLSLREGSETALQKGR